MRLTPQQKTTIRRIVADQAGEAARVRLFGSRLDDTARGGDVDLLVELDEPVEQPARLSATLSARISRQMQGRRVDVVLSAPNLRHLPIHDVARREGVIL
ncbi:nucleotidyltransferase domain-containing protein [Ectothiorhodospira haloalkaliphila]|uniref:nucleotidyltransferase domain-containing protein n=1 Tax=Ectothiorhodospira haloalkaliphila TaxID=421628 RepID=UPI001EE8EBF0|nr:nucleotidyltransferase domain-containing protein [Ectothiorhodospira haloalkaliphila]MCG5524773.1 nucleotidyltransferase domain-containing protein [Ectothiorhodospira haloalkaliphila]